MVAKPFLEEVEIHSILVTDIRKHWDFGAVLFALLRTDRVLQ